MKNEIIAVLALASVGLSSLPAHAALRITEVAPQASSGTASNVNGDWWELTNTGPTAVNLGGYQWADTEDKLPSTDSNFFPSFTIQAGQSIIILDEVSADAAAWRTNWLLASSVTLLAKDEMVDDSTPDGDTFSGLGSADDGVFFYDPAGTLLSSYLYVANTRGVSFEVNGDGVDLGLSVMGQNGAYQAVNGDIGSPGVAVAPVPLPAAVWLMLPAIGTLARRARRAS